MKELIHKIKNCSQTVVSSRIFLGVAVLLALNLVLLAWQPLAKINPETLPSTHTWVWWGTKEYLQECQSHKSAPDIVLLGSSLVMIPVCLQDADFLKSDIDATSHHRSHYMEHTLASALNLQEEKQPRCFNFALPGGMISDDYMVARALFRDNRKPKAIVLGLTLRDFIDSHMQCPASTDTFRYLQRFDNIDDLVDLSMPQFWQRIDYLSGKGLYLWGKKLDLQAVLAENTKAKLNPLFSTLYRDSALNHLPANAPTNSGLAGQLKPEIEPGMFIVHANDPHAYEDNSNEYRARFRGNHHDMFNRQLIFLRKFLALAASRHIPVVLVNMPLRPENMQLMPPCFYDRYLQSAKIAANEFGTAFVDLNSQTVFEKSDFRDTAHMNGSGGKKLIDQVVAAIAKDTALAQHLERPTANSNQFANTGHSL